MKICQITSRHTRYDQRIFLKIARTVKKYGHESVVLCTDLLENEIKDGVEIRSVKYRPASRIKQILFSSHKLFKEAMKVDADIYQLHDPDLLRLANKLVKKNKKVVFDSHENYENVGEKAWIPTTFLRNLVKKIYISYEKRTIKKISGVITVTPSFGERFKELNNNLEIITNFPLLAEKTESNKRKNQICFGGTFSSYCHKELINVLEKFGGKIRYRFLANAPSVELNTVNCLKGWEYVDYSKPVPFSELKKIYNESFVGVALCKYMLNTNYKKGSYGIIKMFEMMAEGLPVLCTDFDIWKEVIDKYECGIYVNPNSEEEIYNALKYMLEHKECLAKMGENGRRAVEQEYNWSTQEQKLIDFYNKVIL